MVSTVLLLLIISLGVHVAYIVAAVVVIVAFRAVLLENFELIQQRIAERRRKSEEVERAERIPAYRGTYVNTLSV